MHAEHQPKHYLEIYTNSAYYFCFDKQQYYNQKEMNKLSVLWKVFDRQNPQNSVYPVMAEMILESIFTNTRYDINEKMLDCFIKRNNRSFVIHFILLICAFDLMHIFATHLVYFPSRKRRIWCIYVDIGVCRYNPYLVVFVQPDCYCRSTLLVGFLTV